VAEELWISEIKDVQQRVDFSTLMSDEDHEITKHVSPLDVFMLMMKLMKMMVLRYGSSAITPRTKSAVVVAGRFVSAHIIEEYPRACSFVFQSNSVFYLPMPT
jgi:hypothetical protein